MLFQDNISNKLKSKSRMIVITNVCNLNCGGCCQLIGHFKKDQLWFITLEELEKSISLLEKYPSKDGAKSPITIFGGEPTLHPEWDQIVLLLKKHAPTIFWINTNGRLGHKRYQKENNLVWWVDLHPDSQNFVQTLYASSDAIKLENDMQYWRKAQKDCPIWNGCQCSIYKQKAYFCETAAAIDWLYNDGVNGWEIKNDKNPFDRTKKEIDEQAKNLCKRCGWCVQELVPRQLSKEPSYVSLSNQTEKRSRYSLTVLEPTKTQRWGKKQIVESMDLISSIGFYRIIGEKKYSNLIKENDLSLGIDFNEVINFNQALSNGKNKYDWIIVLEANELLPFNALLAILDWIYKEKSKEFPRLHMSLPIYEIPSTKFDPNMLEPSSMAKNVSIAFHKNSKEIFDKDIYSRLGHRNINEGSGRVSLWHDNLTDIVGGIVHLC